MRGNWRFRSRPTPEVIGEQLRALGTIDHIVWLAPEARLASLSDDALIAGQQQGVMQCFRLIKALLGLGYGGKAAGLDGNHHTGASDRS